MVPTAYQVNEAVSPLADGEIAFGFGAAFAVGPRFEDCEKLTRRDLRSLRDKFASGLIPPRVQAMA